MYEYIYIYMQTAWVDVTVSNWALQWLRLVSQISMVKKVVLLYILHNTFSIDFIHTFSSQKATFIIGIWVRVKKYVAAYKIYS